MEVGSPISIFGTGTGTGTDGGGGGTSSRDHPRGQQQDDDVVTSTTTITNDDVDEHNDVQKILQQQQLEQLVVVEEEYPIASWFDETQQHFVTLLGKKKKNRRLSRSNDVNNNNDVEDHHHHHQQQQQILILPGTELIDIRVLNLNKNGCGSNKKIVRQQPTTTGPQPPPSSLLLHFHLPTALVAKSNNTIPMLIKLSLDMKLVAIQFTDTLIRIVPVLSETTTTTTTVDNDNEPQPPQTSPPVTSTTSTPKNHNHHHWTIELEAGSGEPILCSPDNVPKNVRYKAHYYDTASGSKNSIILGLIWSDHGGNSQDLTIVTTKAILCYKISIKRNQMASTHTFPHHYSSIQQQQQQRRRQQEASSTTRFWYEPTSRTLMIGSIGPANECSNYNNNNIIIYHKFNSMLQQRTTVIQMRTFVLQFPPPSSDPEQQQQEQEEDQQQQQQRKSSNIKSSTTMMIKKRRLPRFELPPPKRFPPFAVGFFCLKHQQQQQNSNPSISSSYDSSPTMSDNNIRLVNLYGRAYVVDMYCEISKIWLFLYKLDPNTASTSNTPEGGGGLPPVVDLQVKEIDLLVIMEEGQQQQQQQQSQKSRHVIRLTQTDIDTKLINVVDNILTISFRESKIVVYIDVGVGCGGGDLLDNNSCFIFIRPFDNESIMDFMSTQRRSISTLYQNILWDSSSPSSTTTTTRATTTEGKGGGDDNGGYGGGAGGRLFELSLNIETLASSVSSSITNNNNNNNLAAGGGGAAAVIPFLLRRSYHHAHDIALSKFSDAMSITDKGGDNLLSSIRRRQERRNYIETVVRLYTDTMTTKIRHQRRRPHRGNNNTILTNDWRSSLSLIQECASSLLVLLPQKEVNGLLHESTTTLRCDNNNNSLLFAVDVDDINVDAIMDFHLVLEEDDSVLYQTEIIQKILLPMAKRSLLQQQQQQQQQQHPENNNKISNNNNDGSCDVVIDIAVGLVTSLDQHRCLPCPALEYLVVVLLWRMGYTQELIAFLQSRHAISYCRLFDEDDDGNESCIPPDLFNVGTWMLVSAIHAMTKTTTTTTTTTKKASRSSNGDDDLLQRQILLESTKILSSRVSDPRIIIRNLLSQGRLSEAMAQIITLPVPDIEAGKDVSFSSSDGSCYVHSSDIVDDFLRAIIVHIKEQKQREDVHDAATTTASFCKLLICIHSLLTRLDPGYLDKAAPVAAGNKMNLVENRRVGNHEQGSSIVEGNIPWRAVLEVELKPLLSYANPSMVQQVFEIFGIDHIPLPTCVVSLEPEVAHVSQAG